jgi:hypothetical protein
MAGRRKRGQTEPEIVSPNALVASAARLDLSKKPRGAIQQDWQAEAWDYYDTCGELRYAANWMGNSLSRATIYAADLDDNGQPTGTPTTNPLALAAAHDLLGGPSNQAQILQQVGVHLTIAGDCYIIGETPVDQQGVPLPDDEWYVASTDELSFRSGAWVIDRGNGRRPLAEDRTVIIRVWNSHPRKKWQADSPVRAVLPVLRELRQLQRVSGQQMDSRLAGAGILVLPIGVQFPEPTLDAQRANPGADPLMLSLAENIMVPLEDPEDSSRLVPMTMRVPVEAVDKVKLVTFASQLWAENTQLREACIRRLALGLDMPPEQLLGMSDANHWGAWQIEESGVKLHVTPRLTTIVNAINEGYYEPALERQGLAPWKFTLWFDTSELVQRPNRSQDAQWAYDHDELGGKALRRELGFDESDAPSKDEKLAKILAKVVVTNPELLNSLTEPLLRLWLGGTASADEINVPVDQIQKGLGEKTVPDQEIPDDTVPSGTDLPDTQPASVRRGLARAGDEHQEAMLTAATEVKEVAPELATPEIVCAHLLTNRALELAGKRLLTREIRGTYQGDLRQLHLQMKVTPGMLDRLLSGAWDWVDEIAVLVRMDPVALRAELSDYVGSLLTSGQRHEVRYLQAVVRKAQGRVRGAA